MFPGGLTLFLSAISAGLSPFTFSMKTPHRRSGLRVLVPGSLLSLPAFVLAHSLIIPFLLFLVASAAANLTQTPRNALLSP